MKKIILSLSIFSILFVGCKDFIEEENLSNVGTSEFYSTADGYESLVTACYSNLREIYGDEPWLFCAGTDMYVEGRNSQPVGLSEYRYLTPSESEAAYLYNACYEAIQASNIALYYNDITEKVSTLDNRKGEALYLRANAYFLLVQTYGGVAIVTDMIDEAILSFSRSSAEEVYSLIVSDLEEALDLVSKDSYNGRVNERAVQHLLAKVLLTRGYESFGTSKDFSDAAAYADAAIGNQSLTIPFAELWEPGNEMNSEVIFSIQYDSKSIVADPDELGHSQGYYFGPYMGGSENAGRAPYRSYNLCPTEYLLSLYEEGDERWDGTFMTSIYEDAEGINYYGYYTVEDLSSLSVAHYYAPKWKSTEQDEVDYLAEHPGAEFHYFEDLEASKGSNLDFETIPVRKFDDPNSQFERLTNTRDLILSRLGETYLIAAEAYLQAGFPATGLDRLNAVRNRAHATELLAADFDLDAILDERAMELVGEYHRWFDLKRTGTLVERCVAYNHDIPSADYFTGTDGVQKILRPIPQEAIDLNRSDYEQNPGY